MKALWQWFPFCFLAALFIDSFDFPSSVHPIRLCVDRLSVWPQHHLEHADVPAEHPTGHLLHPHPGLPHLRLRPGGQLQLHQHRTQHRPSQHHQWSVVLIHLSCSHFLGFACIYLFGFILFDESLNKVTDVKGKWSNYFCLPLIYIFYFQILPVCISKLLGACFVVVCAYTLSASTAPSSVFSLFSMRKYSFCQHYEAHSALTIESNVQII